MAAVRQTLELDLRGALAQIQTLEKEIGDLRKPVDIPIEIRGDAVADVRTIDQRLEEIESSANEVNRELSEMALAAGSTVGDFSRLARELDVSEDEARKLTREILETRNASERTADAARDVARQMGLSEDEATRFAAAVGKADGQMDRLDRSATQASGGLDKLRVGFGRLVLAAGAFIGAQALGRFAAQSIQAFSNLEESTSKAEVVFGRFADTVLDFTSQAPQQLGSTQAAALEAAASVGNLFLSIGFGQEEAAGLSTEIVQLGTDLASFNNITVDEALIKLRAGLVGETEPLRTMGVLLSEAAVSAKAMELGLGGATGALSEAEKVQARYAIIMEQTTTAQGDFARTSEGIANSTRIAVASFEELKTTVGEGLAPAFAALVQLAPEIIDGFEAMVPNIAAAALALADFFVVKPGQADFLDFVNGLGDLTRGFGQLGDLIQGQIGAVQGFNTALGGIFSLNFDQAAAGFEQVAGAVTDLGDSTAERVGVQSLIDDMREGIDPTLAFANALAFVGRRGIIDPQTIKNFQAIAGLDTSQSRAALQALIDDATRLGFTAEEVTHLERAVFDLNAEFNEGDRANADYLANIATLGQIVEQTTPALLSQASVLTLLRTEADLLGISLGDLLAGGGEKFPELAGLIGQLEPATAGLGLAAENLNVFAATFETTNVRISDAIDEFGLLPDKIEISKAKFLDNLEISAAEEAEFQANLVELFAIAPALASRLQAQGPAARQLVEDFLADTFSAERAESVITGTAEDITGTFTDSVAEFIEGSDLDETGADALRLFLEGFGNTTIAEAGVAALQAVIQGEIDKMKFVIPSGAFAFEEGGIPFTGGVLGNTPPGGGGSVVVNINNPVAQDLPTNAAQAGQSIGAATSTFNRIVN